MIWFDLIWFSLLWYDLIRFDFIRLYSSARNLEAKWLYVVMSLYFDSRLFFSLFLFRFRSALVFLISFDLMIWFDDMIWWYDLMIWFDSIRFGSYPRPRCYFTINRSAKFVIWFCFFLHWFPLCVLILVSFFLYNWVPLNKTTIVFLISFD